MKNEVMVKISQSLEQLKNNALHLQKNNAVKKGLKRLLRSVYVYGIYLLIQSDVQQKHL